MDATPNEMFEVVIAACVPNDGIPDEFVTFFILSWLELFSVKAVSWGIQHGEIPFYLFCGTKTILSDPSINRLR